MVECCAALSTVDRISRNVSEDVSFVSHQTPAGYDASELKTMDFLVKDLAYHYSAAEMLGAGFCKDCVAVMNGPHLAETLLKMKE